MNCLCGGYNDEGTYWRCWRLISLLVGPFCCCCWYCGVVAWVRTAACYPLYLSHVAWLMFVQCLCWLNGVQKRSTEVVHQFEKSVSKFSRLSFFLHPQAIFAVCPYPTLDPLQYFCHMNILQFYSVINKQDHNCFVLHWLNQSFCNWPLAQQHLALLQKTHNYCLGKNNAAKVRG